MAEEQETLWKSDPKRYAKCSEPFADSDAANAAIEAFLADVSASRERHSVADVEVLVKDSYLDGDEVSAFMSTAHFGSQLEREAMLAYGLGQCQKAREQLIGSLLSGKGSRARKS